MIAAIENGMIAALAAAGTAGQLGYKFRTLDTYPENWDEYLKDKVDWKAPAAWAVFGGAARFSLTGAGRVRISDGDFGLVVAAENLRNETATRHGGPSASEPGSYQLLLDALAILTHDDLGLDIDPLMPLRVMQVRTPPSQRKISLFAIQFRTAFEIDTLASLAALPGDFDRLHLDWDVPPFGRVDGDLVLPGVQLPAPASGPGSADASDHLTLPQD